MEIDIHCHQRASNAGIQLLNLDARAEVNFDEVQGYCTMGIHPWDLDYLNLAEALQKLEYTCRYPWLLALGECGLDKTIATPLPLQIEVFSAQIALAKRHHKPLIVHCVRAYNELLSVKKHLAGKQIWILHGFNAHPTMAEQCLKAGCHLSFGHALLRDTGKARTSLLQTPIERLFLETDACSDITIGEIYVAAAKILDLDLHCLQRQIVANFHRVFTHD